MLRSFRVKMIALASAVCAATLIGFGLILWSLFHAMGEQRMDREIQHLTLKSLQFGPPHELLTQEGLVLLGEEINEVGIALVRDGELKVHTPLWPAELSADRLPEPEPLPPGTEGALHWPPRWPGRRRSGDDDRPPPPPPPPGADEPGLQAPPSVAEVTSDDPQPGDAVQAAGQRSPRGEGRRRAGGSPGGRERADTPAAPNGDARPPDGAEHRRGRRRGRGPFGRKVPDETFSQAIYTSYALPSGPWRVGSFPAGSHTLHVAVNLSTFEARAAQVHRMFLGALAAAFLVAGGGGWWIASRALKPVTALGDAAEQITAAQLDRRIPEVGVDEEFARLIRVFNAMLERLQGSYLQAVRFSADASHELKTPLAVIQGEVETALGNVPDGTPAQAALGSILEEIQRLKGLMHALLVFSRLDAGTLQLQRQPFDLAACVRETCEDGADLAPELRFEVEVPDALPVEADPSLLPSAVRNLIGNASKYNRADGWVKVELASADGRARLRVSNSGPVIAPEHREQIFDRFFRADPSRTGGGHGLGLSLAREFARAHGGELTLVESGPEGTVFELTLAASP
ncbi:MAG: HAMP domain-containing protein [Planctomycetes bacterium]|nr:HAMP domain-containing protein [Planctomycetota bacterium]